MKNLTTDSKKILLIDMDQVLVNFHSHPTLDVPKDSYNHENIYKEGYFKYLEPMEGSLSAIEVIYESDKYDLYICTQPLANSPNCFKEKAEWIDKHMPYMNDKIIMTCNKNIIKGDILIDDSLKWKDFGGKFIHFNHNIIGFNSETEWLSILLELL